ncbi:GGDEF domain-containing protein [Mycoplasmopsis primatum]|uniref:DHH family phosphoesterase n=1 Tax=Mycoplasmopsis primatum TaxID=55604 RepID=UPI0004956AD2|nr:DHH family phosphoesterase [Mycoplasmopsis primatum]
MNLSKKFSIDIKKIIYIAILLAACLVFASCIAVLIVFKEQYDKVWAWCVLGVSISVFIIGVVGIVVAKKYWPQNAIIKRSFNYFIDEIISHNSFGLIIYDNNYKILWTSIFIKNRFGRKWVGTSLIDFFKTFNVNFDISQSSVHFKNELSRYEANIWPLKNCVSIKDETFEKKMIEVYSDQLPVIGEVEIDNYQLFQSILSEEELYKVNREFMSILDELVVNYNLAYRQYTNGKFLVFTNKISIKKMSEINFSFFSKIHSALRSSKINNLLISISAGFALGFENLWEKTEQAKAALLQAQSRGGDQVAIFSNTSRPKYFGSSSEILYDVSRTKIKAIANVIEGKLSDPKIKKVICYGHANADLDAIGSALGIWTLAKQFGKESYICSITQDATTKKAIEKLELDENIFIKPQAANKITDDETLVFLLDNSDINRTDNPDCITNAKVNNIFILDHHRLGISVDFCPKVNRYIDSAASSTSEIVVEIMMFVQKRISVQPFVSQMLLNGIYLDTLQFTKHINARTFIAAGWLEERGADSSKSSEVLKIDEDTWEEINELLKNIQEVKPGYFLAYKDIPLSNDVISIASEEILKISGRKAAFVVAKLKNTKMYKLSARGLNVNVQLIAENVGGGGHYGTAAAVSSEDFSTFIDNIKQAIVSEKNESYTY